jgi:outer membrane autotransporter protein
LKTLGFPRKRRKRHAETTEPSGKSGFNGSVYLNADLTGGASEKLAIDGDCTFGANSNLFVTCKGNVNGDCDVISVTGYATLGGNLYVQTFGAYPAVGNDYWFITSPHAISGSWASVNPSGQGTNVNTWTQLGGQSGDGTVKYYGLQCIA